MSNPILPGKVRHDHSHAADAELTIDPFNSMSVAVHHDEHLLVKQVPPPKATLCKVPQNEMPQFERRRIMLGSAIAGKSTVMRHE